MPTYTAEFHTDAGWALLEIKATTPEKALAKARAVHPNTLDFQPYDDHQPINYITIRDKDCNDLAEWQDDELRLQLAARDLLSAAEKVIASWESGDLAAAVRELNAAVDVAKGASPDDRLKDETVIVEVLGGVAHIKECPAGVTVKIIDHDIGQHSAKAEGGAP